MSNPAGTAVVSGATGALGAELVVRLTASGAQVHALGRNSDALADLAARTGCVPHTVDVTDVDQCAQVLDALEVDVLLNCAGTLALGDLAESTADDVDSQIAVNLTAAMHLTRLALPGMLARRRGEIVNIGSIAGLHRFPGHAAYHASKAGLHAFSRQLRLETLGTGLRVTEISPGRFRSDMLAGALAVPREHVDREVYGDHPWLAAEDVADAVMWALSRPPHVSVDHMEILPTIQVPAGMSYAFERKDP